MRRSFALLLSILCVALCSCGQGGVSQEEYDKVVAERDSYKEQLEELSGQGIIGETKEKFETTVESKSDSPDISSQVEVVAEYSYENSIGDTIYCMIIKNNSGVTVSVENNVTALDEKGNVIGASSASEEAIESGFETCLQNYFSDNSGIAEFKYSLNISEDDYYEPILSDLEYQVSKQDKKVIITCTNMGEEAAEFVETIVLFFLNGELVQMDSTYIVDDESELKPGATLSKEVRTYDDYDDVQVYFTGRR